MTIFRGAYMKRIIPFFLIVVLSITCLSACDSDDTSQASDQTNSNTTTQESVGVDIEESTSSDESDFPKYNVVRVVDGDTLVISYNGVDEKLRLIGVDTPESVHPDKSKNTEFGNTVSSYSKSQLEGKSVGIEFDVQERDQYGRLLAYIYIGNKMYNKTLLSKGYASVSTYPPNVKYVDEFTKLQKDARENQVGMWAPGFKNTSTASSGNSSTTSSGKYKGHIKNKKFHISGCRYGEMISEQNLIIFTSRDLAINEGYAACKVCNP